MKQSQKVNTKKDQSPERFLRLLRLVVEKKTIIKERW